MRLAEDDAGTEEAEEEAGTAEVTVTGTSDTLTLVVTPPPGSETVVVHVVYDVLTIVVSFFVVSTTSFTTVLIGVEAWEVGSTDDVVLVMYGVGAAAVLLLFTLPEEAAKLDDGVALE